MKSKNDKKRPDGDIKKNKTEFPESQFHKDQRNDAERALKEQEASNKTEDERSKRK